MRKHVIASGVVCGLLLGGFGATTVEAAPPGSPEFSPRMSASSATCAPTLFTPPSSPGYASTTWPTEHGDVWRSHAVAAGLPSDVASKKLHTAAVKMPPVPMWGYVGKRNTVYVMGGAPYLLDMFTKLIEGAPQSSAGLLMLKSKVYARSMTPYIARINTKTMKSRVLELKRGVSANYTGGALVHSNGSLYAVARSTLYNINPKTFRIVKSKALPLAPKQNGDPNRQTAYNGMVATQNGDLILKGWASTGGGDNPPGILMRIDPDDLSVKAKLVTSIVASARMATVLENGQEYVYFPNGTKSVRIQLTETDFIPDTSWGGTYMDATSGMTTASSDVFMGSGVVFSNNTNPTATTPMQVYAQSTAANSTLNQYAPFTSTNPGWNFFMMAGDPYVSGISVVEDELSGSATGYLTCNGGASLEKLWENDTISSSAGMAVNYASGHVYTDDRECKAGKCRLYLVVLNLATGEEIARVAVKGSKPSVGQIFVGKHAVYYVATNTDVAHGYVTKVTAE